MRYHFVKPQLYNPRYGIIYECNHEVYSKCTLYLIKDKGLAVIQQRYDKETKTTWWTEIDPYLVDALYLNQNFEEYFNRYSGIVKVGLYGWRQKVFALCRWKHRTFTFSNIKEKQ